MTLMSGHTLWEGVGLCPVGGQAEPYSIHCTLIAPLPISRYCQISSVLPDREV